jgi:deoxyribonuclease-4
LGSRFLVLHVGSRKGIDESEAIENVSKAINRGLSRIRNSVRILLENTAGMGSEVGSRFEEIEGILERIEYPDRAGVCFDTAHAYEAGYDISTQRGLNDALAEFDRLVGLARIHVLHLNDSKTPLGSRVDRHWHIGEGFIGRDGFRAIVNHPALRHLPAIMETPRIDAEDDMKNMRVVRRLIRS